MIIRRADKNTEAGVLPDGSLFTTMFQPSFRGSRVTFTEGRPTVIDGPFAEANDLIAGFTLIEASSKQEAIEWVKRSTLNSEDDVEIEIREGGCPGGLAGIRQSRPADARRMRFVILLKSDEKAEAGAIPDEQVLAAMGKCNDESVKAGVLLAGEGLQPSSKGSRVKFSRGKPFVIDGPFTEAKELVAGFWLIEVTSKEEAIEWVKRYPYPISGEGEVEIRQVFETRA